MVFDPLIYQGMAEMHDRHRDMRLDVDNMSYEVSVHFLLPFYLDVPIFSNKVRLGM